MFFTTHIIRKTQDQGPGLLTMWCVMHCIVSLFKRWSMISSIRCTPSLAAKWCQSVAGQRMSVLCFETWYLYQLNGRINCVPMISSGVSLDSYPLTSSEKQCRVWLVLVGCCRVSRWQWWLCKLCVLTEHHNHRTVLHTRRQRTIRTPTNISTGS